MVVVFSYDQMLKFGPKFLAETSRIIFCSIKVLPALKHTLWLLIGKFLLLPHFIDAFDKFNDFSATVNSFFVTNVCPALNLSFADCLRIRAQQNQPML